MNKKLPVLLFMLFALSATAQQKVIQLYKGVAPGSEKWTWNQTESADNMYHGNVIYNVSHPTLTVYPADSVATPTGTAVIVCPGGGLQTLSIEHEGYEVAKWLQSKGITAFLLEYRLMHTLGHDPYKEMLAKIKANTLPQEQASVAPLAVADGRAAIAYVRTHAAEYGLSPDRIGIMGFSAGGTIAAASAFNYTPQNKPDFVAPIYAYFPPEMQVNVPADAPPMFLAAAADDQLSINSAQLYNTWTSAKHSAELHIFLNGGHGFGMKKQGLASDSWTDLFETWMRLQGFSQSMSEAARKKAEDWANWQKLMEYNIHNDWGGVKNYQDANAKLPPPAPGEKRIVFMGNSITQNWANMDSAFFKSNNYIGRGIGGQTSSQMLVRFREDVVNLHPLAVVISAGTNDIAQNTGYIPLENIYGNIVSMAEIARANGIKPIMTSILPATEFSWHKGLEPAEKIVKVNRWVKAYAAKNHLLYVDYWSAMVNDKKGLRPELTLDGLVHPNMDGYKIMEPLAKKAIDETLNSQSAKSKKIAKKH